MLIGATILQLRIIQIWEIPQIWETLKSARISHLSKCDFFIGLSPSSPDLQFPNITSSCCLSPGMVDKMSNYFNENKWKTHISALNTGPPCGNAAGTLLKWQQTWRMWGLKFTMASSSSHSSHMSHPSSPWAGGKMSQRSRFSPAAHHFDKKTAHAQRSDPTLISL